MTVRQLDQLLDELLLEGWQEVEPQDLSLLTEQELVDLYHNVYECGCDACNEKLEAIAEEFFK